MVTVGALIKHVRLLLINPEYDLVTKILPIPSPDPKFILRVVKKRS